MSRGAVAAGSPYTVDAGLFALRAGGNAVDAAVAASLTATVAEPLLTGMGGAGLAMVRMNGAVELCDLFSDMPGRSAPQQEPASMHEIVIDFGPATQAFLIGPGAVAVPGMPAGLFALHQRYGKVALSKLVQPAVRAARDGVEISLAMERVGSLLWPVQQRNPWSARTFGPKGRPLVTGERFYAPEMAETLQRYALEGPGLFSSGAVGQAMLGVLKGGSRMTADDLGGYRPRFIKPLKYRYRDATIWTAPPPSVAGILLLQALRALEDHGPMPPPLGASQVHFLAHAMDRIDASRRNGLIPNLFNPSFIDGFLTAIAPEEMGEDRAHGGKKPGHTTHISVVDESGNAVSITHSLGETSGVVVPDTGVLLNNFLGEEDVNPPSVRTLPGDRLMTMCCPTIVQMGDQIYVLGASGSSRIRSAVLHGIVYLIDHNLDPGEAVSAPRSHMERGVLHVESDGRPPGALGALGLTYPNFKRFDGANMFFGGLHVAGFGPNGFSGAGDARRSGVYGAV